MKLGILTKNAEGWCSTQLRKAMRRLNITSTCFGFRQIVARVGCKPVGSVEGTNILSDVKALITRPIGRGSLEEIIFRMDLLHRLEHLGLLVINPATSIERSVDKYYALALLEENGLSVPRTIVTESYDQALNSFSELNSDIVLKPLFGSRGVGSTRICDLDVAMRIFRTVTYFRGVLYLQEFIPHGGSDIRVFVVGDRVVAAMQRKSPNWKTNVSLGGTPVPLEIDNKLENLAIKASQVIGCKIAGVDIVEGPNGPLVLELNSQPGWRGLQTVTRTNIANEIVQYVIAELKA